MSDITVSGVKETPTTARFYRNDKGSEYVELSFVGSKDTLVQRATAELRMEYKDAYDAYCDGVPLAKRQGTALTTIMDGQQAESYIQRNVHTLEEFAALTDGQCQSLGHGTLTLRKKAQAIVGQAQLADKLQKGKRIADEMSEVGKTQADAVTADIQELKGAVSELTTSMGELTKGIAALITMQAERKKPGPKPKPKAED